MVSNSDRAILVNIQIMRAFSKIREMISIHSRLWKKIEEMESKYNQQFKVVFEALRALLNPIEKPSRKIGFVNEAESKANSRLRIRRHG